MKSIKTIICATTAFLCTEAFGMVISDAVIEGSKLRIETANIPEDKSDKLPSARPIEERQNEELKSMRASMLILQQMVLELQVQKQEEERRTTERLRIAQEGVTRKKEHLERILAQLKVDGKPAPRPITEKPTDIARKSTIQDRRVAAIVIYDQIEPFRDFLSEEKLRILYAYIEDTKVEGFSILPLPSKPIMHTPFVHDSNWWDEPNVSWSEYHRVISIIPSAAWPHVYENWKRASFGIGRPNNKPQRLDWDGLQRFLAAAAGIPALNAKNQENYEREMARITVENRVKEDKYTSEVRRANAARFPAVELADLISQYNDILKDQQ